MRVLTTIGFTLAAVLLLYLPGVVIGIGRRIAADSVGSQVPADIFALAVAVAVLIVAARTKVILPDGYRSKETRLIWTVCLATVVALGLRALVMLAQVMALAPNPGYVQDFSDLTVVGIVTTLMRFCIQPAIFEEVSMRGFLQPRLVAFWGRLGGIVYCALFSTAVHWHLPNFEQQVGILLFGSLVLGSLMHATKSLWVAIGAHLVFNGSGILLDIAASRVVAPGRPITDAYELLIPLPLICIASVTAVLLVILMMRRRYYPSRRRSGD